MIHFRSIFYLSGWLLIILAMAMMIPVGFSLLFHYQNVDAFVFSSIITLFTGVLLVFSNRSDREFDFGKRDTFLVTSICWVIGIAFSSLPFIFSNKDMLFTDAAFEAVSGLTTTGATIFHNLQSIPPGLLVWRAMLEWLGGIGIVVMALTVMTELRIGGLELFQSESSDKSEKLLPRVRQMAKLIFTLYVILTILCFTALFLAGMGGFDAFCHTLTCVSTGGFSTYDASIGHFNSRLIELIIIVFMFIGGCSQLLFARTFFGKKSFITKDSQFRSYVKGLLLIILATIVWRLVTTDTDPLEVIVKTLFNITAIFTTTGYASEDYMTWGPFAMVLFFILPFIGGCTGSTTGGIKIYRFQVLWSIAETQLKKLRRPHGVFVPKFNGKRLSEDLFSSVAGFVILFVLSFVGLALTLAVLGVDFLTAMSAAAAVLTNLGPGLGDIIGPTGNYSTLSEGVKWCLMVGMIMGRLELLTIYVLFLPSFWKD